MYLKTLKHKKISFARNHTGKYFKTFSPKVKNYLKKNKASSLIEIIDYIYPINKTLPRKELGIKDHINLSGENPLKGPVFISLTNVYKSRKGIIIAGLKQGIHPNNQEKKILRKINVKAYCYNLVPTVIFAASLGLKIKAVGIVK